MSHNVLTVDSVFNEKHIQPISLCDKRVKTSTLFLQLNMFKDCCTYCCWNNTHF